MRRRLEIEIKVGFFVAMGLGLIMLTILILGSTENLLSRKNHYLVHFPSVEGLIPGAKVVLSGLQVGTVTSVGLDLEKKSVRVDFNVEKNSAQWIRTDSIAEIATQGVLGDKFIAITAGSSDQKVLPSDSEIPVRSTANLSQFISSGDQLMASLNSVTQSLDRLLKTFEAGKRSETFFQGMAMTAKNLSLASEKLNRELESANLGSAVKNLNKILDKINNGTGTLGALVNDPALYDDAKALVGSANRSRVMRNLVRQTIKKSASEEAGAGATSPANK